MLFFTTRYFNCYTDRKKKNGKKMKGIKKPLKCCPFDLVSITDNLKTV